ncbi:Helix-turn-helix domain [Acidipropionibacterium jensenii]|uniref:Helix-turn-helix domain n=1 Tax=Acidipropionibacterium jensenii TaxID=1749 RepID=A0A448P141_9ACTN|nr:helix-turn-helix domain-containing protein [Acidipropionibacterium jensenii]VEI03927.1 Helix-turn-helix domain [Acidipropionibacterium jensenii]
MNKASKSRGAASREATGLPNHEVLNTAQVSEMTGVSQVTLRNWRHQSTATGKGVGPKSFKMAGVVRYRRSDVEQWIDDTYNATVRGEGVVVSR